MAQSTTTITACDAVIELADENDILRDISGSANECNLSFTKNVGGVKVFGSSTPIRHQCGNDFSVDMTILMSTALNEGWDVFSEWNFGGSTASRRFRVRVPDSEVGGFTISGKVVLSKLDLPLKSDDASPIQVKASMMADGDPTYVVTAS